MQRPFISHSVDELEDAFERAESKGDAATLQLIAHELGFRKTPRARELRETIAELIPQGEEQRAGISKRPIRPGQMPLPLPPTTSDDGRSPRGRRATARPRLQPTQEQAQAIDLFRNGGSLKINAYAGSGKTSTLEMLAHSTQRRGQYLAFNRDIVADARNKFPNTVNCSTTHGLAYKAVVASYQGNGDKLTGRMNANQLAEVLGLEPWRIDKNHILKARSQAFLILDTVRRFAVSADPEPLATHVPRHGSLLAASEATLQAVTDVAVRGAKHVWARMQDKNDPIPLGHDGYLKLWALSKPVIAADFILMDEAQDTNPVVLDVLRGQPAQMTYVGDKYQQIYEWRGAVNAMEAIATDDETFLTTSFRFGSGIADGATRLLALLGESRPLRGNPALASRIGPVTAGTVLARTNAYTITAVIEALDAQKRPHLVGGTEELMKMLRGVSDLKKGEPSDVPEFFGFANWQEVVEFVASGEGEHLKTFVNLVETRGERQLMWALGRTVEADGCDVVVSTAHKAKGREWPTVRLMDDFLKSQPKRGRHDGEEKRPLLDPSELRLLYVALTRAKVSVEVPAPLLAIIGLAASQAGTGSMACAPVTRTAPTVSSYPASRMSDGETIQVSHIARPEWKPPENWKPEPATAEAASRSNTSRSEEDSRKRKGFLGWLLGS